MQIKDTANFNGWDKKDFDFKIFDNPNEMYNEIKQKNDQGYKARVLAGYAWKWTGVKQGNDNSQICDVEVPEFDFKLPWNSRKVGTTWAIDESGISQVGCIHTSQGLEFDYIGVIVGADLKFNSKTNSFFTDWDSYKDAKGKQTLKNDPEKLNKLVRNIYKILMTRAMKGCYVYFVDKDLEKYFTNRLNSTGGSIIDTQEKEVASPYKIETKSIKWLGLVPASAAEFDTDDNSLGTVEVDIKKLKSGYDYFIVKAKGDSMNLVGINDGDKLLCRVQKKADTGNKVVVFLQDRGVTVKEYGERINGVRKLLPRSSNPVHQPIIPGDGDEVQGIFQEVLKD